MELGAAVRQVADCPCPEHQQGFVTAVRETAEMIVRVVSTNISTEGSRIVGPAERTTIETVPISGTMYLHAFSSLDGARRRYPGATFAGVPRDEALRMACADALGGLVVTADDDSQAWAVITRDGLISLLDG